MTFFSPFDISIIVPFYNEKGNIEQLVKEVSRTFINYNYELILVDDGSTDGAGEGLKDLLSNNIKLISLDKNYGQSAAIKAGFDCSRSDTLALLDGDLQNLPEDLVVMLQALKNQPVEMVQGCRVNRLDSAGKRLPSFLANRLIQIMFGLPCRDVGCSTKVFKKQLLHNMVYFKGFHRYIPLIAYLQGFKLLELEVGHNARTAGQSKYGAGRIWPVVYHLFMLKFFPQKLVTPLPYSLSGPTSAGNLYPMEQLSF
jgi:glycosyltransferase involved in cell wall biosynthesis